MRIARYAAVLRTQVALHNAGSLVLTYANAHFGASFRMLSFRKPIRAARPLYRENGRRVAA